MRLLLPVLTLGLCSAAFTQNMTVEEFNPKSLLVVPEHKPQRAKFPLIDVHNHQRTDSRPRLDQLVKDMDALNIRVMVNLSGGFGERLKTNIANMDAAGPGRFAVFANMDFSNIDDPGFPDRVAKQFAEDVRNGARGLKIFKDFGMDRKDGKGNRIPVDDPRFDKIFELCGKLHVPVLIHTAEPKGLFEPMDANNERWLELKLYPRRGRTPDRYPSWETLIAEQHRLFAKHPNTIFINAHLGWLGIDLARLGQLLDRLPNVYTEISAVVEELARQPRFAKKWFIRYQDRVMFGKDTWNAKEYPTYYRICETDDEYFDHDRKYHGMWKAYGLDLPDDVLKKLYYKNALKVIPGLDKTGYPD